MTADLSRRQFIASTAPAPSSLAISRARVMVHGSTEVEAYIEVMPCRRVSLVLRPPHAPVTDRKMLLWRTSTKNWTNTVRQRL